VELTHAEVEAFILGSKLPPEKVVEIRRQLDIDDSVVQEVTNYYSQLVRLALDPQGPIPGLPLQLQNREAQAKVQEHFPNGPQTLSRRWT
jgi:hypothetical protein